MIRTLTVALLLAAAACGGKSKPDSTPTAEGTGAGSGVAGGEHGEHGAMTPELTAFHDLLKPRWHAAEGPQRIADTCSAIDQFTAAADAIGTATPPVAANADTWTAGTRALVAAVADLGATCKANNTAGFQAAFAKVHDAFHVLMQQAGSHGAGHMMGSGAGGHTPAAGAGSAAPHDHQHKH